MVDIKKQQIVREKFVRILLAHEVWICEIQRVNLNDDLRRIGMDSITFVEILSEIETEFMIKLDFNQIDFSELYCIKGFIKLLNSHIK